MKNIKKQGREKKRISNNVIAFLALLFMLSSSMFNWVVYNNSIPFSKVTGKASDQASVSLCIGAPPPYVNIIYPNGGEVVNGTIWINATASHADFDEDINISFTYGGFTKLIGKDTDESDIYYNHTWDTTAESDGNCNCKVFALGYSNKSICRGISGTDGSDSYFSINNVDQEPNWDNFKNNATTNFTEFEDPLNLGDWTEIENATIGIPETAIINFSGVRINFDNANFDSHLNIEHNYVGLDSSLSGMPCLNRRAVITLYNISFLQPKIMKDDIGCDYPYCTIINYENDILTFNVTDFTYKYSSVENATINLTLWDDEDNSIKYVEQQIKIYANLSDSAYSNPLNGSDVFCNIRFNTTGSYGSTKNMNFNESSGLYEYERSFSSVGKFGYVVYCNESYYNLGNITDNGNITITNRAPVLISNMPNETWNENTILTGRDLDDYFIEPDGEGIRYTSTNVPNINVSIDNITHVVTYTPDANFHGNRTVKFYAYDPHNARADSNIIFLFVIDVPDAPPSGGSSGGGGGGGGSTIICEELWECTEWGKCLPSGIQIRKCTDLAECGTDFNKPYESRSCEYIGTCDDLIKNCHDGSCELGVDCGGPCPACPTCSDGIQNQGEKGVDCGGPCPACPTCSDGIQNQGEKGVDCGGPCDPCPSCNDGIRNCHDGSCEEKVDCGGPCPACKEIEIPVPVERAIWPSILLIIILITSLLFVMIRYHKYYHPFISKILMKLMPAFGLLKRKKETPEKEAAYEESALIMLRKLELKLKTKKTRKDSLEKISKELMRIVRAFISGLLKIEYEFTYEELCNEITKHKISTPLRIMIITFFKRLSEINYKGHKISKKELIGFIKEARIIAKAGIEELSNENLNNNEKIKNNKKEAKRTSNESRTVLEIYKDLIKANKSLKNHDMDSAKLSYIRIKENYDNLPLSKKRKIYKKIVSLYKKIKEKELEKVKIR
jgi:hypothetical protein